MFSVTGSTRATGAGGASDSLGSFTAGASVLGEQATRSAPALAPMNRRRVRADMTISTDPGRTSAIPQTLSGSHVRWEAHQRPQSLQDFVGFRTPRSSFL